MKKRPILASGIIFGFLILAACLMNGPLGSSGLHWEPEPHGIVTEVATIYNNTYEEIDFGGMHKTVLNLTISTTTGSYLEISWSITARCVDTPIFEAWLWCASEKQNSSAIIANLDQYQMTLTGQAFYQSMGSSVAVELRGTSDAKTAIYARSLLVIEYEEDTVTASEFGPNSALVIFGILLTVSVALATFHLGKRSSK